MNKYTAKFSITGTIYKIGEIQTFASGFTKREIVVNTNTDRESPISVNLYKEDVTKADSINLGDEVSVEGAINGHKWDGPNGAKFFTDLIVRSIIVTNRKESNINNWQTLLTMANNNGIGEEEVKRVCEEHKQKIQRKFTESDWADVANILINEKKPEDDEEIPF